MAEGDGEFDSSFALREDDCDEAVLGEQFLGASEDNEEILVRVDRSETCIDLDWDCRLGICLGDCHSLLHFMPSLCSARRSWHVQFSSNFAFLYTLCPLLVAANYSATK